MSTANNTALVRRFIDEIFDAVEPNRWTRS